MWRGKPKFMERSVRMLRMLGVGRATPAARAEGSISRAGHGSPQEGLFRPMAGMVLELAAMTSQAWNSARRFARAVLEREEQNHEASMTGAQGTGSAHRFSAERTCWGRINLLDSDWVNG